MAFLYHIPIKMILQKSDKITYFTKNKKQEKHLGGKRKWQ